MAAFERFAAIDWSGAKGRRHKGIAIAICAPGDAAPELLRPGHIWSRTEVLDWLRGLAAGPGRTLAAMDFSFAPPLLERGSYLPGTDAPARARDFWAYVDNICDDADLGAASFLHEAHRPHFYMGAADGVKADYMFYRVCEAAFNAAGGGKASTIYDAIGAGQVAKASFAGMRLLRRLGDAVPVWPFDFAGDPGAAMDGEASVVAEMYSRAFIRMSGVSRGLKLRDAATLNRALAGLGSKAAADRIYTDHETDVLVSAAGLRRIADDRRYWVPEGLTREVAETEGWTLGVR
ncbi:hypothetical protein KCG44_05085 [Pacificimonas sp. WHA3]|uniref:DUF429 domain-containing protein n=1 Tax=Pacificimonas pallii TaxID=2827236 RepID=A0ABS6SD28_9SPHN|nr:hypothetical protein [Pacificimonas pallii]MBV7256155.1 hypothetical protein [Pacificimonas pallii]